MSESFENSRVVASASTPTGTQVGIEFEQLPRELRTWLYSLVGPVGPAGVSVVAAGVTHDVYYVEGARGAGFVKARTPDHQRPVGAPEGASLALEVKATEMLHRVAPLVFPRVVAFEPRREFLMTYSVMRPDQQLWQILLHDGITPALAHRLGYFTGAVQRVIKGCPPIRPDGDVAFRQENLDIRLRFGALFGQDVPPQLEQLALALGDEPAQLIVGDLQPKNVGASFAGMRVCDLEMAHAGSAAFDAGFFGGHLAMHALDGGELVPVLRAFEMGYALANPDVDMKLVAAVTAATMYFRSAHPAWGYECGLDAGQLRKVAGASLSALDRPPESVTALAEGIERNIASREWAIDS